MSERGNRAKRRRVLSLSKNKNGGNAKRDDGSAATPSIASFFGGAPPPKLACPLCGQLVPRYGINEHIDLQCANFDRGDKAAASAGGSVAPRVPLPPQDSRIKSPDRDPSSAQREDAKTSPYFKKRNSQAVPREMGSGSVVRTVDLGKLSSKLSTRRRRSLDGTQTLDKHAPHRTEEEGCEALGSSQKENNELESLDAKGDRFLVAALTADVLEDGTPSKLADPLRRERGESLECESAKSETINPVLSLKLLSPSFKPKNGGKGEASEDSSSTLRKRARYDERGKEQEEVDISGGLAETVDKNQHSFKETSTALCSTPWSQSLKVHEGSTSAFDSSKQMESGASNAIEDTQNYHPPTLPYYLRNFQSVLKAVLENEDDSMLFNQEDLAYIRTFEKLSVSGRKLYVRLFQRKLKWLQVNKLDYEEICSELGPVAQELVEGGFLQSEQDLQDLREALELLPAPELKGLAKTFHLGGSGTQKQQLVDGLLRLSRQKSLFAVTSGQNSIGAVILKRAKRVAGSCVRLSRVPRAVFSRVLLLFSLTDSVEEEEMAAGGQGQLYTILLVNSGRLAFPDYTVQRCAKLFQDREDLIRYEAAMRTLQEVITAMQAGLWEDALELYTAAKTAWQELRKIYDFRHQEGLPVFLRCFTSGWAYTRIRSRGVEILQRLRRYQDAVEELQSLLAQWVYCPDSRGRWWDRLALNLHQHLKKPEQAICAIRDGLSDPLVRTGHQLSLHQRAVRMKESPSFKKYHLQLRDLPAIHIQDVTHVTIRGQLFPHEGGMGKSVFLMPANEETGGSGNATIMCSVEELALAHYRQLGFDQGIHGEGSTFSTLFGLLLWDIIFMEDIPDVFRNPYQTSPLDLFTDCFYENRREAIDTCVQVLGEASTETLHDMLEAVWTSQEGKVCSLVNWKCFSSLQQAQSLVSCLGGTFLGAIITRMAKDYRHCRGGLPDLLVWSTSNNIYKLVEVKGPNDRLSQKQQIWLDELQKLGADVEVCHVTAVGARGTYVE